MNLDDDEWEERTSHRWVDKSCLIDRGDDREAGTIVAVWLYQGEPECVAVDLESGRRIIAGMNSVEVL